MYISVSLSLSIHIYIYIYIEIDRVADSPFETTPKSPEIQSLEPFSRIETLETSETGYSSKGGAVGGGCSGWGKYYITKQPLI